MLALKHRHAVKSFAKHRLSDFLDELTIDLADEIDYIPSIDYDEAEDAKFEEAQKFVITTMSAELTRLLEQYEQN